MKKITITFEDDDDFQDSNLYWNGNGGRTDDPCRNCPNRPRPGELKACACALPYFYGPYRVTC